MAQAMVITRLEFKDQITSLRVQFWCKFWFSAAKKLDSLPSLYEVETNLQETDLQKSKGYCNDRKSLLVANWEYKKQVESFRFLVTRVVSS